MAALKLFKWPFYLEMDFDKLPSEYSYLLIKNENDLLEFRIKEVNDGPSAKDWIARMSQETKTTWRVSTTYPKAGRYNIFKIGMQCQHNTNKRARGVRFSKNTNCPSKFRIIIKRYVELSRSKNVDPLIKDWPAICIVNNQHNHAIESAAVLQHRDLCEKSKETLCSLFRKGHNPSSALHCLKTDLLLEHGDDYYEIAADGYYLPSLSIVSKLFQKEFSATYGALKGPKMFEDLQDLLTHYVSSCSGKAEFHKTLDGQNYFVVLLTPIMLRVHQHISQTNELVLVDASGGVGKQRRRIYFFTTPTTAGSLPAGVIISDTGKESVFNEALMCFKNMLGSEAFFGNLFPKVFLTDIDLKEKEPLAKLFPQSTLLLCQVRFLKSVWSWLCNKKNKVKDTERQEIYFFFKQLLYSKTEFELNVNKASMMMSYLFQRNNQLSRYLDYLWEQKEDWALCYRQNLPTLGNNTTNYLEVAFRVLKDCILNRIMAFNLNQLIQFILTSYEDYMSKLLIDIVNGRTLKSMLQKMISMSDDINEDDITPIVGENFCYKVKSKTLPDTEYFVDIIHGVCSCPVGEKGNICEHASAIIIHLAENITTAGNVVCESTKQNMFLVATGQQMSPDWLLDEISFEDDSFENTFLMLPQLPIKAAKIPEIAIASCSKNLQDEVIDNSKKKRLSNEEVKKFEILISRMMEGCSNEPDIFVPAVQKMLENADSVAATQSGLISAMYTFGLDSSSEKRLNKHRPHDQQIGVQPTAISRRTNGAGKRKLSAGRSAESTKIPKELHYHDYTSLGSLLTL